VLRGESSNRNEEYYFEHMKGRAVRKDGWKLVAHTKTPDQWQLYNVENDLTEMNDLAKERPEIVMTLEKDWERWANRVGLKFRE